MKSLNITELGQVFTPDFIVDEMLALIKNGKKILEPSAGDGAFVNKLEQKKVTAIELDIFFAKKNNFLNLDFFNFPIDNKFDTIIGNPPYVKHQEINKNTLESLKNSSIDYSLFDNRTNLYLFFIYKCILHLTDHGELIFITPRDFLKATSAIQLNNFIYANGTISNLIELGDKKIFKNASPSTIIWRFEKNNFSRHSNSSKNFIFNSGQLLFTANRYMIKLVDIAYVKVGGVSGADKIFINDEHGQEFIASFTHKTGKIKKMLYNTFHEHLLPFKERLLKRKIKRFNADNWYYWGRNCYISEEKRVYVNIKTRQQNPFFLHQTKLYDGSILGIFPKNNLDDLQLKDFCAMLNNVNWQELGFFIDGRYIFSQRSLENILLPIEFKEFL